MGLPSGQSNNDGGYVGESHLPDDGRPARVGRSLQAKEEEDPAKEAFNGTAFAQFLFGPRRRQTRTVFLSLGIPGNHRNGSQSGMDPVDELKAPIARIQADDTRANAIETDGQL